MTGRGALCVARALGARAAEGALRAVHFADNAEISPRAAAEIAGCLGGAFVPFDADGDDDEEEEEEEADGEGDDGEEESDDALTRAGVFLFTVTF